MGKNGIVQLFFPVKVKIHNLMISKLLVDYVKGRHKIAESLGGVGYVGAGKKGGIQNGLHAVTRVQCDISMSSETGTGSGQPPSPR